MSCRAFFLLTLAYAFVPQNYSPTNTTSVVLRNVYKNIPTSELIKRFEEVKKLCIEVLATTLSTNPLENIRSNGIPLLKIPIDCDSGTKTLGDLFSDETPIIHGAWTMEFHKILSANGRINKPNYSVSSGELSFQISPFQEYISHVSVPSSIQTYKNDDYGQYVARLHKTSPFNAMSFQNLQITYQSNQTLSHECSEAQGGKGECKGTGVQTITHDLPDIQSCIDLSEIVLIYTQTLFDLVPTNILNKTQENKVPRVTANCKLPDFFPSLLQNLQPIINKIDALRKKHYDTLNEIDRVSLDSALEGIYSYKRACLEMCMNDIMNDKKIKGVIQEKASLDNITSDATEENIRELILNEGAKPASHNKYEIMLKPFKNTILRTILEKLDYSISPSIRESRNIYPVFFTDMPYSDDLQFSQKIYNGALPCNPAPAD